MKISLVMSDRGLTQTELARRVGCNRVTVCKLVNGWEIPRPTRVKAIAEALDWPQERAGELFQKIEVN